MGKIHWLLSVNLSKARDNSTWAVSWLAELTVTALSSPSPAPLPRVRPKNLRVWIQDVPVCTDTTPACFDTCGAWCRYTRGRFESTHGGFFCVPHHTPQTHTHTPHTHTAQHTPPHNTQHTTQHTNPHAHTHHNTRRQTDRQSGQKEREKRR